MAIVGNQVAPGLLDRYLASSGYTGQLTHEPRADNALNNLFQPLAGQYGAHGRFDNQSRNTSWEFFTDRHRKVILAGMAGVVAAGFGAALGSAASSPPAPADRGGQHPGRCLATPQSPAALKSGRAKPGSIRRAPAAVPAAVHSGAGRARRTFPADPPPWGSSGIAALPP